MAKDLPYFKFFCSEWNDGDITLESYEIQGLFINICSYYWSKECNVTKKLIYKRFKDQKNNLDILTNEGFLKFNNEHLSISFLNEQFSDVEASSKSKSLAGKKSAKLKKLRKEIDQLLLDYCLEFKEDLTKLQQEFNTSSTDVDFLLQQISTIKIRRDKKREDKIKEDNNNNIDVDDILEIKEKFINNHNFKDQCSTSVVWKETIEMQNKLYEGTVDLFLNHFEGHLIIMEEQKNNLKEFKQHFIHWLKKQDLSAHRKKVIGKTNQV